MGILQKDRRGTKGTKPPIPVPAFWLERIQAEPLDLSQAISDDTERDLVRQLQEQVLALSALPTIVSVDVDNDIDDVSASEATGGADMTWLDQSKRLKTVESLLLRLNRLPEMSSATLGLLRNVLVPMFVECFFLPSDVIVRRQTIPLIKALSAVDPSCVDSALQANLLAFIGAQGYYRELNTFSIVDQEISTRFYSHQTVHQRAMALETLASVPQGAPVIRRFVSDVLVYSANALETSLPDLHSPKQGQGSVELVALRQDCTQVIRLVFLCLSKLIADDLRLHGGLQAAILASMRTPLPGYVDKTLERIYQLCWDLVGCESAALNSRQVAAMVLVSLIDGSGVSPADRATILARLVLDMDVKSSGTLDDSSLQKMAGYLPLSDKSESRQRCMDDAVSMVCVARAIIAVVPYKVSLETLDIASSQKNFGVSKNVHEAVFTHVASVCGRSQLAPGVKVIVFESMATWLEETARLLERCLDGGVDQDLSTTAFELGQRILKLQRERIMGYLWSYWDDPLDAVQVRVKSIFEAFLDIGSAMDKIIASRPKDVDGNSSDAPNEFLSDVLDLVLTMDWSRKVKYSLLATLCTRVDIFDLFVRQPNLLDSCLETLAQVNMASRASSLFTAMLDRSAADVKAVHDKDAARVLEDRYMDIWTAPVVAALCRDDETSRRMLVQHLLPTLFETFPRIVEPILRSLIQYQQSLSLDLASQGRVVMAEHRHSTDACRQHALIIVLKIARSQDIITFDQLAAMDRELVDMLKRAVYHPDWSVRADMLGLLCEARKLSNPLHEIEYELLFKLLRVSANAPSADFRQQQHGALTSFAMRLVTIATHAERIVTTGKPPVPSQKIRHREKAKREAAIAQGLKEGKTEDEVLRELGILSKEEMVQQAQVALSRVEQAVNQWLDMAVRGCLYPGAGFAKVAVGLRWLEIISNFFTPGRPAQAPDSAMAPFHVPALAPPNFELVMGSSALPVEGGGLTSSVTAEEVVTVLAQVLIDDPFDANRTSAFSLLTAWPLVAADSEQAVAAAHGWASSLLQRALRLVNSTRAGESESGALIVRWVFRKFVVLQGMRLDIGGSEIADDSTRDMTPDLAFANGLLGLIRRCQTAAERNLLDAAQRYPLHGLLTAAQYVADEIDYRLPNVQLYAAQWRQWLVEMSKTAIDVCNVVLGVLTSASPEGNIPSSFREMEDKIDAIIKGASADNEETSVDEEVPLSGDVELDGPVGPRQQVILSYCWRAIKEVSGLLATVATAPPGSDEAASRTNRDGAEALIDEATIGEIGALLRTLLTSIRHRGAFSAVHPAFTDVCGRMFRSPSAELNHLVSAWLDQCLDIATICRVSVTRRSAGWPLCLLSILTCDKNAMQALLPRAMERIFALANDLQTDKSDDSNGENADSDGTTDLPQVHAINMLRVLLEDHTLASDIVPYVEHAYVLSLTGLRSRRWAIRNVCSLLYAALTRRVFGNSTSREETKYDGITGRELFTRFPGLHPFLSNQLEDAVDRMAEVAMCDEAAADPANPDKLSIDSETGEGVIKSKSPADAQDSVTTVLRSGARFIHPALYPCLILLARLQPSPMDSSSMAHSQQQASGNTADDDGKEAESDGQPSRPRRPSEAARLAGVVAALPHTQSAANAVAPPMNLEQEMLTKVNERNSTVHVTSASAMLSMYSFTDLVEMCVDSPVYKTREMAARAYAPLVPSEQADVVVVSLLKSLKEAAATVSANSFHGTLCQVHELLRVHWRMSGSSGSESLRQSFVKYVFPELVALWPIVVHRVDAGGHDSLGSVETGENEGGLSHSDIAGFDLPDILRHKYLTIINEYVARGEEWLLQGVSDARFIKKTRLVLSRFRVSMLYGSLHPMFSDASQLLNMELGDQQTPSAYGTVLELVRLYLACVDDRTMAVVQSDGTVQLEIEGELLDEHGALVPPGGSEVMYNPGSVVRNLLECNGFYESKLLVLEWLTEHLRCERMEIFGRISMDVLLPCLVTDTMCSDATAAAVDPMVRAASTRLLALLCTKLEIDPATFPVHDLLAYWDNTVSQMSGSSHCPLSVAMALVELQAGLLHMLRQSIGGSITAASVGQRSLAWAQHLYEWTDPERAAPYRHAVSRALVTYSAIKRYNEAGPQSSSSSSSLRIQERLIVLEDESASEEILRLCYWRLLQDDDEDIRDFIAKSISRRLGHQLACDQACERLVFDFAPSSGDLFPTTYARNRLDYLLSVPAGQSAIEAVDRAVNPSHVLFDHENPNIYIDEPRNKQLAYYSLVRLSDIFIGSAESQAVLVSGAMKCVEALEAARKLLLEIGGGSGVLGATSMSALFALLQSWVLGARLALVAGARMVGDLAEDREAVLERVLAVARGWLESPGLQPVHPWISRSLRAVVELAAKVDKHGGAVSQADTTGDLFLLTYV
ncbi:hypothetical protein GGI15_003416 [Coemansia interrupta]|uniref:DUF2428 domain-containing protein n=1 Tax=Coemansia interrupta TaxID=1126814 RepID=A0A9W8LIQ1_9FUNG|nr:hypothetical protein GGI15_003416 [Coemansia interrupta]